MPFANGVKQLIRSGTKYVFWGPRQGNYTYGGTSATHAVAGTGSGMNRLKGVASININIPEPRRSVVVGDNVVYGQFTDNATDNITGTIDLVVQDLDFLAYITGQSVYTINSRPTFGYSLRCNEFNKFSLIINTKAQSSETATQGQTGWEVLEIQDIEGSGTISTYSGSSIEGLVLSIPITINETAYWLDGEAISNTNYGSLYDYARVIPSDYPMHVTSFRGDNSDTGVTLTYAPVANSTSYVEAVQAGTRLVYGSGAGKFETVSTALTYGTAPGTDVIVVNKVFFDPAIC